MKENVCSASSNVAPLYPISCGRNWGYGSACPPVDDCVVLDLSGLTAIELDDELGLITVEPGVTQQMLYEHLKAVGDRWIVPTTGAGPTASVLGNALERGYGLAAYTDHFGAVTDLEAILADGSIYKSAHREMGADRVAGAFKWGIGPYLDGLFTQGGFGIVVRATIALAPRPERVAAFVFQLRDDADLDGVIEPVRDAIQQVGGVIGGVNLMNDRRLLAMFDDPGSQRGVPADDLVATRARQFGFGAWAGLGTMYGSKRLVKAAAREVKRCLRGKVRQLRILSLQQARLAERLVRRMPVSKHLRAQAHGLVQALENASGIPNEVALPLCYLGSGTRPPEGTYMDPARDGCGLIWYAPLVPFTPTDVRQYVDLVQRACRQHDINPLITLTTLSARCIDSTVPLLFDRADPAACARAQACYEDLFETGRKAGYVPYRLGVDHMHLAVDPSKTCWQMGAKLKAALDPQNIISPGRYGYRYEKQQQPPDQATVQ